MLPLQFFLPKSKPYVVDRLAPLGISFKQNIEDESSDIFKNLSFDADLATFRLRLSNHPLIGSVETVSAAPAPVVSSPVPPAVRVTRRASISIESMQADEMSDEVDGSDMVDEGYPESLADGSVRYVDDVSDGVSLDPPPVHRR